MILLSPEQVASLDAVPEYRMGCHRVHAWVDGSTDEFGYILNQTIFLPDRENHALDELTWESLLQEAGKSPHTVSHFRVIPREPETLRGVRRIAFHQEELDVFAERTRGGA